MATEVAREAARTALIAAAPPGQESFSAIQDPEGAESQSGSNTLPPLESSDDEVIHVDDEDDEGSLPDDSKDEKDQRQGDPDDPDAPSPTPDLDLDDYEKALDIVGSSSPLPVNKHTQFDWADYQPPFVGATVTEGDNDIQTHPANYPPTM